MPKRKKEESEDEDYFEPDKDIFKKEVKKRCEKKKISATDKKIEKIVTDMIYDFFEYKPADKIWKIGLDDKVIKKYEPRLIRLREKIKEREPTMIKILRCKISDDLKIKALQCYDSLFLTEKYSVEWLTLCEAITLILEKEEELTREELEKEKLLKVDISTKFDFVRKKIINLDTSDSIKSIIYEKYLSCKDLSVPGLNNDKSWLNWTLTLPFNHSVKKECNIENLELLYNTLNQELCGMDVVKKRVLEFLVNKETNPNYKGTILALKGSPGTGKTEIVYTLSKVFGLPFEKISLGGMSDSTILRGSPKLYVNSSPSIILQILTRMKCNNGIILFDEIDKISHKYSSEIQNTLIHITDYTQNHEFKDDYISEFPHDISKIMFICTLNNETDLSPILKDRLEIINIPDYTDKEKEEILLKYIFPKEMKNIGLDRITLSKEVIKEIINNSGTSIRYIKSTINKILSRINYLYFTRNSKISGKIKIEFPLEISKDLLKKIRFDVGKEKTELGYFT